jgi:hypothetical protein
MRLLTPDLSRLHSLLNSKSVVPDIAYRRNKAVYELVCYVNCLIGCVLSDRGDAMPAFIRRSREFMDKHPPEAYEQYYSVVRIYLAEVKQTFGVGEGL